MFLLSESIIPHLHLKINHRPVFGTAQGQRPLIFYVNLRDYSFYLSISHPCCCFSLSAPSQGITPLFWSHGS
nr:MAG TPA: hypothetical protein [Caudoviricetes sp.]